MKTTFVPRRDWIKKKLQSQMVSLHHQVEFQIFFHTVTFCLPVCLVCVANRSIHLLLLTTFLQDPTEPEVQRCFLLPFGLRAQQFRLCLIGMVLTRRDSRADQAARTLASLSSSLAQSCFSSGSFESNENEDLVPRLREIRSLYQELCDPPLCLPVGLPSCDYKKIG